MSLVGVSDPSLRAVEECYIAYFGRPGDVPGATFWGAAVDAAGGPTTDAGKAVLADIADDFKTSPEYTAFSKGLTNQQLVEAIYQNVLHRAGDVPGVEFWTNALTSIEAGIEVLDSDGKPLTKGGIAIEILKAARDNSGTDDAQTINNLIDVSVKFTSELSVSPDDSAQYITDNFRQGLGVLESTDHDGELDYTIAHTGEVTATGTTKDDTIIGFDFNDLISGLAGNDTLLGLGGDDIIFGNSGADSISGGEGADTLYGGDGNDYHIDGNNGNDTLYGGNGDDHLDGGNGDDVVHGDAGDDVVTGNTGSDILFGDVGNDDLSGGSENDRLFGGAGRDILRGDSGHDALDGGVNAITVVNTTNAAGLVTAVTVTYDQDELIGGPDGDDFIFTPHDDSFIFDPTVNVVNYTNGTTPGTASPAFSVAGGIGYATGTTGLETVDKIYDLDLGEVSTNAVVDQLNVGNWVFSPGFTLDSSYIQSNVISDNVTNATSLKNTYDNSNTGGIFAEIITSTADAKSYLVIDYSVDGTLDYDEDLVVEITGFQGTLDLSDFIF